jgi:hypothetical protein
VSSISCNTVGLLLRFLLIGTGLLRKLKNAVPEGTEHVWAYHEFTRSLLEDLVAEWRIAVEAWEKDQDEVNPFVPTVKSKYVLNIYYVWDLTRVHLLAVT